MNGFADKGLDESNFGSDGAQSAIKSFDAFPKTKANYTTKTSTGGFWTILLLCASVTLTLSELRRWWTGDTTHTFSVEQGVGHDLQINLDVVVAMKCEDLHVNVQDASGDRILAGQALKKDPTTWDQWGSARGKAHALGSSKKDRLDGAKKASKGEYKEEDVHDYLGAAKSSKKFSKTPKLPRRSKADSCRMYGTMHGNKVQGDFHITARGHGYMEIGQHLDHKCKSVMKKDESKGRNTDCRSVQLLASRQRAFVWPSVSLADQPARQHCRDDRGQFLQIPVLHVHRADHLYNRREVAAQD